MQESLNVCQTEMADLAKNKVALVLVTQGLRARALSHAALERQQQQQHRDHPALPPTHRGEGAADAFPPDVAACIKHCLQPADEAQLTGALQGLQVRSRTCPFPGGLGRSLWHAPAPASCLGQWLLRRLPHVL